MMRRDGMEEDNDETVGVLIRAAAQGGMTAAAE
jgi:hypothetical protein